MEEVAFPQYLENSSAAERINQLIGSISEWFKSEALERLVVVNGDSPPPRTLSGIDLAEWYDNYSAKHWDFRKGLERNMAEVPSLPNEVATLALESARSLGLLGYRPPKRQSYQHTLILGGLIRACIVRPRYAASLMRNGVRFDEVTALGAFRDLVGDELLIAEALKVEATNEFDAMVSGMSSSFNSEEDPKLHNPNTNRGNLDWQVATINGPIRTSVVVAPSRDETRRANTADTLAWWADREGDLTGTHILVITSQIYVPYQGANALEFLGLQRGAVVETVGVPDNLSNLGQWTQRFLPHQYLQETRSAIRGYFSLLESCLSMATDISG